MPKKLEYEYVKEYIEQFDYIYLSKEYKDSSQKLELRCPKGHIYRVVWRSFQQGIRCPKCANMTKKKTIKEVKEYIEQFEYVCLSEEYESYFQKLEFKCPKGHIYRVAWSGFQQGYRCPECSGKKKKTLKEVKQYIEQFGYECLSKEYKGNYSKLKLQCPKGHIYEVRWDQFQQGNRCLECWKISQCGPGSHLWRGGIAAEPYCDAWLDQDYKQSIKDRDGNLCLNPYCFKRGKMLVIHHIDYDKKNCHPLNLITLCNSCNSFANKNREWHTAWYNAIIYNRYENRNNIWLQ